MSTETKSLLENCIPRGDRVVVRLDPTEKHTPGGILLPDSITDRREQTGTVIAVGPGKFEPTTGITHPTGIEVGQRVVVISFAGMSLSDAVTESRDKQSVVILREDDVVAFLP
jgi:chaperonin GroES